jgi:hypothetical protein
MCSYVHFNMGISLDLMHELLIGLEWDQRRATDSQQKARGVFGGPLWVKEVP